MRKIALILGTHAVPAIRWLSTGGVQFVEEAVGRIKTQPLEHMAPHALPVKHLRLTPLDLREGSRKTKI